MGNDPDDERRRQVGLRSRSAEPGGAGRGDVPDDRWTQSDGDDLGDGVAYSRSSRQELEVDLGLTACKRWTLTYG